MNPASTAFILGYHGCDIAVAEKVFSGKGSLTASANDYDWLGHGVYFWEYNAQRAFDFASELRHRPHHNKQKINRPTVVGAVIDLAFCLNLLNSRSIETVKDAHRDLARLHRAAQKPMPHNAGGSDRLIRRLDCAVIELLHATREERGEAPFDTVRAAFLEGKPIYKHAGFRAKNHIQICVRNFACIKGYFRPLDEKGKPLLFSL